MRLRSVLPFAFAAILSSCGSTAPRPLDDAGVDGGGVVVDGGTVDSGTDGGEQPLSCVVDPSAPNFATRDSDCDGLTDGDELRFTWRSGKKTDPCKADSDGDHLVDGLEAGKTHSSDPRCTGFVGDADPSTTTEPTNADSDRDGLDDGVEDADKNGLYTPVLETDPRSPDTDSDGKCDGPNAITNVCTAGDDSPTTGDLDGDGLAAFNDPNPNNPDTDGDGLCDGPLSVPGRCIAGEDMNGNGAVDSGETDARRVDTDCDGLVDGSGFGGFAGELDKRTDPTNDDTDDDGLPDGLEVGVDTLADPACTLAKFRDANPTTKTDPADVDTDNDGMIDGLEDANQNGAIDAGESNPLIDQSSNDPTRTQACATGNLVPIHAATAKWADIQYLTRGGETHERFVVVKGTDEVGIIGYDTAKKLAYLAVRVTPTANLAGDATKARGALGAVSVVESTHFITWDGDNSHSEKLTFAAASGVKARANAILSALVPGAVGTLDPATDFAATGLTLETQVARRADDSLIVVVAILPTQFANNANSAAAFALKDIGHGAAFGRIVDKVPPQCPQFVTDVAREKVDIIWSVDNSNSMKPHHEALGQAAQVMEDALLAADIDWRVSLTTSCFYRGGTVTACGGKQYRPFTKNLSVFKSWVDPTSTEWIKQSAQESAGETERIVQSVRRVLEPANPVTFMPPSQTADVMKVRKDAHVAIVFLGDTNDAPNGGESSFETFFSGVRARTDVRSFQLAGILCDGSAASPCEKTGPTNVKTLISAFQGKVGTLSTDASKMKGAVKQIIEGIIPPDRAFKLPQPAIPSTIRIAVDPTTLPAGSTCDFTNVPRNRTNGFDYDAINREIRFFGACATTGRTANKRITVSYRYWTKGTPPKDELECTGLLRPSDSGLECVCQQTISCGEGLKWNAESCACECDSAGMACDGTHTPDAATCGCACAADCGGCSANEYCDPNACACVAIGT